MTEPLHNPRFQVPAPVRLGFRTLSAIAPGPAARLAWKLFATPSRKIRQDRHGVMASAEPFVLRVRELELPAWSWGDGPTVLLLHGWGSTAESMGGFVQPLVEAGFRAVTYDAHAHGRSPGKVTSGPEMARHLVEVVRQLGADRIVAHSMGTVVCGFAMRAGLSLERMVLLNAPADMPYFLRQFGHGLGFPAGVQRRMIERFEREHGIAWEQCVVEWVADGADVPVLLVHDRSDDDIPWNHALRVRGAWTDHHAIETEGLGHRGALNQPEIHRAAVDFLASNHDELPVRLKGSAPS